MLNASSDVVDLRGRLETWEYSGGLTKFRLRFDRVGRCQRVDERRELGRAPLVDERQRMCTLPAGWPEAVAPPGAEDWEAAAVAFPVKFICSTWLTAVLHLLGRSSLATWRYGRRISLRVPLQGDLGRGYSPDPGGPCGGSATSRRLGDHNAVLGRA